MALYFSAFVLKLLLLAPLVKTSVSGGAGRTNLKASHTASTVTRITGRSVVARSRHDTAMNRVGKRRRSNLVRSLALMPVPLPLSRPDHGFRMCVPRTSGMTVGEADSQ